MPGCCAWATSALLGSERRSRDMWTRSVRGERLCWRKISLLACLRRAWPPRCLCLDLLRCLHVPIETSCCWRGVRPTTKPSLDHWISISYSMCSPHSLMTCHFMSLQTYLSLVYFVNCFKSMKGSCCWILTLEVVLLRLT